MGCHDLEPTHHFLLDIIDEIFFCCSAHDAFIKKQKCKKFFLTSVFFPALQNSLNAVDNDF